MWSLKSTRFSTVCSSPLASEVLSGETFGRSLPQCGTGPKTPGTTKKRDFVLTSYKELFFQL